MKKEIVLTLDDYPMAHGALFSTEERTSCFINASQEFDCKVVFFCIGNRCQSNRGKEYLLQANKAGHFLGNHSLHHNTLSSSSLDNFSKEIHATQDILNSYEMGRPWFRYPYLDYGNIRHLGGSHQKAVDSLEILHHLGYRDGYVTISTLDWYINQSLTKAVREKKTVNYESLKTLYLSLLKEWCNHYLKKYHKKYPQEITHSLLLHANDLNALYWKDILEMLQKDGWNIVSPEKAFHSLFLDKQTPNSLAPPRGTPRTLNPRVIAALLSQIGL